jgi:hypothetical protein
MTKNAMPSPKAITRSKIIIIGGEIGGVGKSMVARAMIEQTIAAKHPFYLIDADASTPNVGLTYEKEMYERFRAGGASEKTNVIPTMYGADGTPPVLQGQITFTGNAKNYFEADQIIVLAQTKDVVVVLPSQVASYVQHWIKQNDIIGMLADSENTIDVYYFFVTNGTPESIALFAESVESCQGKIPHVLVKNYGAATNINWSWFDYDNKAATILNKYGFKSVVFPELEVLPEVKTKIISEHISFSSAIADKWMSPPSKRRIKRWLGEATLALGSTELVPYHPDYLPKPPETAELPKIATNVQVVEAVA